MERYPDNPNSYACGVQMSVPQWSASSLDKTGADNFRMKFCDYDDWDKREEVQNYYDFIEYGYPVNRWRAWVMCNKDMFITHFSLSYQKDQGPYFDDALWWGLRIRCANKAKTNFQEKEVAPKGEGEWQDWNSNNIVSFVTSFKVQYGHFQSDHWTRDDTGLHGLWVTYSPRNVAYSFQSKKYPNR
jgi:hypothetical protein